MEIGTIVNLEKSLKVGDELGGHFVYGHVDTTSKIRSIEKINGSYKISFYVQDQFMKYFSVIVVSKSSRLISTKYD